MLEVSLAGGGVAVASVTMGISEIPRAARFKPEDAFKLLTNCGDFVFGLGKTVAHRTVTAYSRIRTV
jgi:hypothetical protein